MTRQESSAILHSTCVAIDGRAVLISGASGSGKSALALELIALGALLVSDDRTRLTLHEGVPVATAPDAIRGLIEARGVGLLQAEVCPAAPVVLAVDLDRTEQERLPPERHVSILGCAVTLLHKVEHAHFPAAIALYLMGGRRA
ncbi:MAG: HPr kinase/phosphatase C-terminal domain-containing protein [Paracoccaceae bacterium]